MSEWWTYRLSSFVLFSPQTYLRLIERYNADVWPLQIAGIALAIAIVVAARSPRTGSARGIPLALAVAWLVVAWAFLSRRYATINWAASYFAIAFVAEALLLAWSGATGRLRFGPGTSLRVRAGLALVAVATAGVPFVEWLAGRGGRQLEWFGTAPDPTVIGTLGALMLAAKRAPLPLLVIPLAWCAVNGAFQWTLGMRDALVLPLTALLVLATRLGLTTRRSPRPSAR
jgi:uncharacterized protein DUF6064